MIKNIKDLLLTPVIISCSNCHKELKDESAKDKYDNTLCYNCFYAIDSEYYRKLKNKY